MQKVNDPAVRHTSSGALIRRFLPYLAKYKKTLFIDLFCAAMTTLCDIILPKIMSTITNAAMGVGITLTVGIVLRLAALYFVLRIIDGAASYYMSSIGHIMGVHIETDMRRDAFDHLLKLDHTYYNNTKVGTIMGRITNDLFDVTEFAHHCPEEFFIAAIKIVVSFIILCRASVPLTLAVFACVPLMGVVSVYLNGRLRARFRQQRVQIGALKALGYSRLAISWKYIGYGLLPSLVGGVLGLVIGYILFPKMIFTAYQIMYQMPDIELHAYTDISLFSVLAAVACTTVATLWACLATLRETPASLMRPRTPKAGKRVFLEYIKPLWRRMSFIHKVTARNLFRYQKRFWMTVIGIGGCTALIIAGFGMRSSLLFTMSRQYDELFHYSAQVTLADNALSEERAAVEDFLAGDSRVVNYIPCAASSATVVTPSYSTTAYVEVMASDEIGKVVDLFDYKSGDPITMGDEGVYIDQKLSELLKVSVGDTFFLDGDVRGDVTVAGIYEHYTGHFIYMTPGYYENALHADGEPNAYLLNFTSDDTDTCNAVFEKLLDMSGVATTSRMRDTQDTYTHSMERVDFVVVIIILAAAALAMVVLFNLSNINITERQRELATIKLLGFYDGEVSAYVYRENIVLTVFGILLGCFMGHWLHIYLVRSTEIDLMMFGRQTAPSAYVYAAILTALFSLLVNVLAHFKMKKIDMVESLKSAE